MKYPGEEFAKEKGYSLSYHNGSCTRASYSKFIGEDVVLHLDIDIDGTAKLQRIMKMVVCTIESFSYPNKNFEMFEQQLSSLIMQEYVNELGEK